jgi:hypothetical protein
MDQNITENFIFKQDTNTKKILQNQYFCQKEYADFIDDNNYGRTISENSNTLAKILYKDNNAFYQIKVSNNNQLFNPISKLDREQSYSFLHNVVRPASKFVSVNSTTFSFYLNFLLTGNSAWLIKAERERM